MALRTLSTNSIASSVTSDDEDEKQQLFQRMRQAMAHKATAKGRYVVAAKNGIYISEEVESVMSQLLKQVESYLNSSPTKEAMVIVSQVMSDIVAAIEDNEQQQQAIQLIPASTSNEAHKGAEAKQETPPIVSDATSVECHRGAKAEQKTTPIIPGSTPIEGHKGAESEQETTRIVGDGRSVEELEKEEETQRDLKLSVEEDGGIRWEEVTEIIDQVIDNIPLPELEEVQAEDIALSIVSEIVQHVCELKAKAELFSSLFADNEEEEHDVHEEEQELELIEEKEPCSFYYDQIKYTDAYSISFIEKPQESSRLPEAILKDHRLVDLPIGWTPGLDPPSPQSSSSSFPSASKRENERQTNTNANTNTNAATGTSVCSRLSSCLACGCLR